MLNALHLQPSLLQCNAKNPEQYDIGKKNNIHNIYNNYAAMASRLVSLPSA